jgi:tetratricopeptide (TPR) repeat protein
VSAIVVSWAIRPNSSDHDDRDPIKPIKPYEPVKANAADLLTRGDNALRQQRYVEALAYYKDFQAAGATQTADLTYRLGLSSEAVGHLDEALASYRQAVATSHAPGLTLACHLGMARCLLRQNRPAEARQVIYPFLFDERRHAGLSQAPAADAWHLVGLSLAAENIRNSAKPRNDDPVTFTSIPLELRIHLDDLVGDAATAKAGAVTIPVPIVVQKRTKAEPALVVSAERRDLPPVELLTQLASDGGFKVEFTDAARKAAADRALVLHLHNWDLEDVLEHAAEYLDLTCAWDGDSVRFLARAEADAKTQQAMRHGLVHRTLQMALAAEAHHPYGAAALLELGNNKLAQNRRQEATTWYSRLIRDVSYSPHVASAHFNLAGIHLLGGDTPQARKALFRVIDQMPGHEMALRASIQIGLLYLHEDDARQAIVYLRRAQALAEKSPYHPVAVLALTAAYLQNGEIDTARQILAKNRLILQPDPFLSTAVFLDRYSQFRIARASKDANSTATVNALIEILWRNRDDTVLGGYGQWLIAEAYRDLEFWDQAEGVLRLAQVGASGSLKICVENSLGDTLIRTSKRAEAAELFTRYAEMETPYRPRARFQLARIDVEEKRFKEAAERCRTLWKERTFADQTALLHLWGAALEGCGELTKAARCYAGKAPD